MVFFYVSSGAFLWFYGSSFGGFVERCGGFLVGFWRFIVGFWRFIVGL